MGKASAQIEITAGSSKLAAGLSAAYSKFKAFGGSVARGMGSAFKAINAKLAPGDTMKSAIGHAGGDLIGKGLGAITDAAEGVRDFERSLIRYQIASGGSAKTTAAMRVEARGVSRDTGIAVDQVLAGAQAYVGFTGDAEGASAAMKLFADVSTATGSSVTDIAQAMAALKESMGITAKDGEAAFSALIVQGKGGAVEVKDMAAELAALAPQFANTFKGGKGLGGLREMGAGIQVIMKNGATASMAATKFRALMSSLSDPKTVKGLKAIGINVYDAHGKAKAASEVFDDLAKSTKLGNSMTMSKIFGREESRSAVLALRDHIGAYHELRDAASDTGAVQRDKMTFLESDAGRLDKAMNGLKLTIAEAFTPDRINAFVNAVEDLASKLGPVMDVVGKIGDALGGLAGVGKSVRGLLSGNANHNPWADSAIADAAELNGNSKYDLGTMQERTPEQMRGKRMAAELRSANRDAYNSNVDKIIGAEVNDRTSPESIKRAYFASRQDSSKAGGAGASEAGTRYLEAAGLTQAQAGAQINKDLAAQLARNNADLVLAIRETMTPTVQIGDNQVAKSVAKSTTARTAP